MYSTCTIPTKDAKRVMQGLVPSDYRKRDVVIKLSSAVTANTAWSGGSRSLYRLVDLTTGEGGDVGGPVCLGGHASFDEVRVDVPAGSAVVQTGTSGSKPATLWVHLNPADYLRTLLANGWKADPKL